MKQNALCELCGTCCCFFTSFTSSQFYHTRFRLDSYYLMIQMD